MNAETFVYEIYDFEELKREMSSGANETLKAIEEKELQDDFISILNEILRTDEEVGKPMTLTNLDDFIDYEADYIESLLNTKLW